MPVPHKPHTDMQTGRIRETHRDLSILITCSTYDRIIYLCLAHTAYFLSSNTPDSDIFSGNRKQVARILAHEDTGGMARAARRFLRVALRRSAGSLTRDIRSGV